MENWDFTTAIDYLTAFRGLIKLYMNPNPILVEQITHERQIELKRI